MCVDTIDKERSEERDVSRGAALRVGVAGLGLIGEGAALRLIADDDYEFCGALVRNASVPRDAIPDDVLITDDIDAFFGAAPDIIIDALPVADAGRDVIEKALARGVGIVSANKQAVAGSLDAFSKTAAKTGAALRYSASVGGGAPMVETVRNARAQGEIVEMTAILNGTVNYILTALANGAAFSDAVRQAQEAGFAEPDPTADLSGDDARAKISILCYEAFGAEIDQSAIKTRALDENLASEIVRDSGAYKQLSSIRKSDDGAVSASLDFVKLPGEDFFASVAGEGNALRVILDNGADFTCADKGAGRAPTVNSLFDDLKRVRAALPPRPSS